MRGLSTEVSDNIIDRVDLAVSDMKSGLNKLTDGTANLLKEASVKVANQFARSIEETAAKPVILLEEESIDQVGQKVKPIPEQLTELKGRVHERMNKVVTGINKGVSNVNSRMEHSVGNMMSKANSAVDDIHSAASNALQGMKDFTDAAADPITKQFNSKTSVLNSKVKLMITKVNRAIDDMKGGMHDLAHGITEGMKEASEKIAAQLAQSVHEHVRQEIELARASEPASLLEMQASLRHNGGATMSRAHSAVQAIRVAASDALGGLQDLIDTAGESVLIQVGSSNEVGTKVNDMMDRTSKAIVDMKTSVREFAYGMTDSLKEASDKISSELTRTVDEHVRRELAIARSEGFADP